MSNLRSPYFFYEKTQETALLMNENVGPAETPDPESEKKEVAYWLRTIDFTEKKRDQYASKAGWDRFVDEFKGKWDWLQTNTKIPIVPVNLVYAYTKTEVARLYFRDPWITVNAKRTEDLGAAQIAEQVINYMWKELDLKNQIKQCLIEALLVGHSWIKTGYVAEFGTVESKPPEEKRGPGRPRVREVETSEFVRSEYCFAYYVPYKDILFDPSATFPATHNARWMAHRIVKPLRAIKESGICKNTDKIKPSVSMSDEQDLIHSSTSDNAPENSGVETAVLWEIYNLDDLKVTTISPGCDAKLREIPYPDYLNKTFPFVQFAFDFVPGEVYPLSNIAPHEAQIIELTKALAIQINHLKRWNRQIIVAPDFLTEEEEGKFKDGNDGAIIKGNVTASGDLKNSFFIPPYAPVQQDVYGVWNQLFDLWRNIAGQSDLERGANQRTATRTLGELRLQLQGGRARADEKTNVLEDCISLVAKKLLNVMQKKFDLPKIARIVGDDTIKKKMLQTLPQRPTAQPQLPDGAPNPMAEKSVTTDFSFSWNKTDISGDMDVEVVTGSTIPMDKDTQLEIMEKLIPYLPGIGAGPGTPAAKAFGREMLRLIGIRSLEKIMDLADETPPQQESQIKLQGTQAEQAIKLQGMKEKLAVDQQKNQMDLQKSVIESILAQTRASQSSSGSNGGSPS